jgi:hypothetical protein
MSDVIEAVSEKLLGDATLLAMLNGVDPVGYMSVDQRAVPPYVLISDAANRIDYEFSGANDFKYIDIEAIAYLSSVDGSGYSVTREILSRIETLLQDLDSNLVNEEGATICLRKSHSIPSRLVTVSGDEQYLRCGREWEIVVSR